MADDSTTVQFKGIAAGTLLPIQVKAVKLTGTDVTSIVGIF